MIASDTLLFVQGGYRRPTPVLTVGIEHPPEVHEFEIEIGGERRTIKFTSQDAARMIVTAPVAPGEIAGTVAGDLKVCPRTGVITITYDDQVLYQGPPDAALAEVARGTDPMMVTVGRTARDWKMDRGGRESVRHARRRARRQGRGR